MRKDSDRVKDKVLILGKLPPPYMGPAIATKIIMGSRMLSDRYYMVHFNTGIHKAFRESTRHQYGAVFKNINLYVRFVVALSTQRPSLVQIPISQSTIGFLKDSVYIWLSSLFGRRVVVVLRGSALLQWQNNASVATRVYYRMTMKRVATGLVLSKRLTGQLENVLPMNRISVVTNGADYDIPDHRTRGRVVTVLYLSNLQPSKGIIETINGVRVLKNMGIDCLLNVVGAWRDEKTERICKKVVRENGLSVRFFGVVSEWEDKCKLLMQADIFTFTPKAPEGQPWSIIEAMACSLPVVSSNMGAIPDMVKDGYNGIVLDIVSPDEIAIALAKLIRDRELREEMGRNSKKIYDDRYTEVNMVNSIINGFESALSS
ncbi:glycosyltransferase family 4 protein [bacterium]|nr:glycosyltransferase family 4 protein [bacterium]